MRNNHLYPSSGQHRLAWVLACLLCAAFSAHANPLVNLADRGTSGRFSHPEGLFTLNMPSDWQTTAHASDIIEINTGHPGAVLMMLGELEPHEIGQPLDRVMSGAIALVDQLLAEFEIYQIAPQGRFQATRAGALDAIVSERTGNSPSGQVRIWHAMTVVGGTAYMLIAALDGNNMKLLQPSLIESFASLQVGMSRRQGQLVADRSGTPQYGQGRRSVVFNDATIDAATLGQLESVAGQIPDGRYWYDRHSGMVGMEGGPTIAYFYANLVFVRPFHRMHPAAEHRCRSMAGFCTPMTWPAYRCTSAPSSPEHTGSIIKETTVTRVGR